MNLVRSNLPYHGQNTTFDVPGGSKFDDLAYAENIKALEGLFVWSGTQEWPIPLAEPKRGNSFWRRLCPCLATNGRT